MATPGGYFTEGYGNGKDQVVVRSSIAATGPRANTLDSALGGTVYMLDVGLGMIEPESADDDEEEGV